MYKHIFLHTHTKKRNIIIIGQNCQGRDQQSLFLTECMRNIVLSHEKAQKVTIKKQRGSNKPNHMLIKTDLPYNQSLTGAKCLQQEIKHFPL